MTGLDGNAGLRAGPDGGICWLADARGNTRFGGRSAVAMISSPVYVILSGQQSKKTYKHHVPEG